MMPVRRIDSGGSSPRALESASIVRGIALEVPVEHGYRKEAKSCGESLDNNGFKQFFHYFSVTKAKIAVLTNGREYHFYSDTKKIIS